MPKLSVIDEKGLGAQVLEWAAKGLGYRKIAAELNTRGVPIKYGAVKKYLDANTEERKAATEQVRVAVQAELQKEALSDVQLLEQLRDELRRRVFDEPPAVLGKFGPITNPKTGEVVVDIYALTRLAGELRQTLALRLSKAGATDDDVKLRVDLL